MVKGVLKMKKIIYFVVLMFILQGCNNIQPSAGGFDPHNRVTVISKGKVFNLPVASSYIFVDDSHKKAFTDTNTFSKCNCGDAFWRSPEFMKTIIITNTDPTSDYLKKAEEELLAGCEKASDRVY
jgi:hypothetical protein